MKSKRVAVVDKGLCVACGVCVRECPRESIKVYKGCYTYVTEESCVGCGKCAKACPVGCITVKERDNGSEK